MIAEQKALMSQLGAATAEEKKEIMTKLRKLGEDMKAPTPAPPVQKQEDVEMEKADQETVKQDGGEGQGQEESTEELQAKLAKLKEEVNVFLLRQSSVFSDHAGFTGSKSRYTGSGPITRPLWRVYSTLAWTRAGKGRSLPCPWRTSESQHEAG